MKIFVISALFFAATCAASPYHGVVSTQYHTQDAHGGYSYGYSDPNSQKHETSSHGVTNGAYSYVDGNGHTQSVKYSADPVHGFNAVGTNFPVAPKAVHPIAVAAHAYPVAPATYAHAYSAPVTYTTTAHHYAAAPVIAHHYGAAIAPAWGHHHEIAPITINAHGVPVDTPEVQHAKAAHFAAHAAANHHVHKRSIWGGHAYAAPWAHAAHAAVPVIHNGVPVDTPEVQHAKAAHFAAHAAAGAGHYAAPAAAHHYAPAAPAIHNGHPVDTPEVQHAKAAHFAAVAEAQARSAHSGHSAHYDDGHYDNGHYDAGHYDSGAYNPSLYEQEGNYVSTHHGNYAAGHHGAYHIPVIHNGVPVETPEVQHAKAAHFAAVAEAQSRAGHHAGAGAWSHGHDDGSSWNHYDGHHHW